MHIGALHLRCAVLLAAVALLTVAAPGSAQTRRGDGGVGVWLSAGPGFGGGGGVESGVGGTFQLNGRWGRHQGALRVVGLADFAGFPDSSSDDSVGEVGITYGRSSDRSFGYTTVAAGLSMVRVPGGDGFYDDSDTTVGIPLVAEVGVRGRVVGVALQAFGNLNPEASYGGLALNFLLGWME